MDISSMKHMDAVDVLRATKQDVKLKVLRRPTGVGCKAVILSFLRRCHDSVRMHGFYCCLNLWNYFHEVKGFQVKLNKQLAVTVAIWSVALIYLRMGEIPHALGCSAYLVSVWQEEGALSVEH